MQNMGLTTETNTVVVETTNPKQVGTGTDIQTHIEIGENLVIKLVTYLQREVDLLADR